jgi:hypothetical protein
MLTATQRRARYAAQPAVTGNGHETLTPAQARRIRHKTRRQGATPARLAASAARQADAGQRALRLEGRARLFLGRMRPRTEKAARPAAPPPPAEPWSDPGHDVAADLRAAVLPRRAAP